MVYTYFLMLKLFKNHIVIILLLCINVGVNAQKYFIYFSDKDNNSYSLSQPQDFLSQRSLERRARQNIQINEQDLPVSQMYIDSLKNMNLKIYWPSKWLNGVIIESSDKLLMDTITKISFVDDTKLIWETNSNRTSKIIKQKDGIPVLKNDLISTYGMAYNQAQTVNGHLLHENGYEGEGILIAVIDNGFRNVNNLSSFTHLWENTQILNEIDIVDPGGDVYATSSNHGTYVLSIMGGYIEGEFKGSAPNASYILLRTEDDNSEYPIEEYNWVIAAEIADSSGADVINSSVGYFTFDNPTMNYSYEDMDGKSTVCVQGAEAAFSKGMLVVCSAGNEALAPWHYIITPSDGENILSVAAMSADSTRASFSSYGPSSDFRVKPDIAAQGVQTALQNEFGTVIKGNGTSFSAPVITGFSACLWQARPELNSKELLILIRFSSHQYNNPDNSFGYGIPDFEKARNNNPNIIGNEPFSVFTIYPNPFYDDLTIQSKSNNILIEQIDIFNMSGNLVFSLNVERKSEVRIDGLPQLPSSIYLLRLKTKNRFYTIKINKL